MPESIALVGPQPKIPPEFFGCWRGTVETFDSVTSLSPQVSAGSIRALSTTYEFCFTKKPDGTGELRLTDVEIGGRQGKVLQFDNRVISVDPEFHRASLKNHAAVESVMSVLWLFPVHVTQDIYADEQLQMVSHDVISVKGKQLVVIGGNMVASMTFHTNFNRVKSAQTSN